MANTKKKQNGNSNKNKGSRRRLRPRQLGISSYQALLADPCNGPVHSAYGGEAGITQRFVQDFTLNVGAGSTSGYIFFCPAANARLQYEASASTISGVPLSFVGPGGPFLATNASKARSAAACVTVIPAATSYNNLTGEIAAANVGYNTLSTTTSAQLMVYSNCAIRAQSWQSRRMILNGFLSSWMPRTHQARVRQDHLV